MADAVQVVRAFLKAQDDRDLDAMCALVTEDLVYINEPLPPSKQIRSREQFRRFFESSPCIWGEDAELRLHSLVWDAGRQVVLTERLDRFKVEGKWLEIPICGALDVEGGKVKRWHDYWDYVSYSERKERLFGPGFSLFRAPAERPAEAPRPAAPDPEPQQHSPPEPPRAPSGDGEAERVARAFLKAQADRDLDALCALAAEDIVYSHEPLGAERELRGRGALRKGLEGTALVCCDECEVAVLRLGTDPASGAVVAERRDRFRVGERWLELPNCCAMRVSGGRVRRSTQYWDRAAYAKRKAELGPDFDLFAPRCPQQP